MGIDYIIDYDCEPKRALTVEGLMGRIKGRDRARAVIDLYRSNGDDRPPSKMGFEMVRRLSDGREESEVIIVQDLLDAAEELTPWEPYCSGCPANVSRTPFGCIGAINYPISQKGERWLLDQLPDHDSPLPFMLLQKAIHEMGYSGQTADRLRSQEGVFMESSQPLVRDINGFVANGDQVFELLFLSGPVGPAHGSLLLQFFGGISRSLDADVIMQMAVPPSNEWIAQNIPFLLGREASDDETILTIKQFLYALYTAYRLGVPALLDV